MKYNEDNRPIDMVAIEMEARRLRAEAISSGMGNLKRWVKAPFHARRHALDLSAFPTTFESR